MSDVVERLQDRIYFLTIRRNSLDRFRTSEREEIDQKINEVKRRIISLKNPPPEKRVIIDELLEIGPDIPVIYSDPAPQLSSFTVEELTKHLERRRKGWRFFDDVSIAKIKAEKEERMGKKKECPPSIKDLILQALREGECTLAELVEKTKGNIQTVKATTTYHLRKQGYNVETIKEGAIEKYRLNGYINVAPIVEENPEVLEEVKPPPPPIKKVSYPKEGVFNFIVKLMKERSYTVSELVELSGASPSTIKQNILYTAKQKGVIVTPIAEAGYGELKYVINSTPQP